MKLTEEEKKRRAEFRQECKEHDHKAGKDIVKWHKDPFGIIDGTFRTFVMFDGTEVSEGGWLEGRKWMTAKEMNKAQDRWVEGCYVTGKQEPDYDPKEDWIPHQCGGCRFFAAFDGDYGVCCCELSPNDGRIVFEHGGCIQHHYLQKLLNKEVAEK